MSGSSSSSMRSRAGSLPRSWCRSTYFSPPPASALACSAGELGELREHRLAVRRVRRRTRVSWIAVLMSVPQDLGGQVVEDFVRAAADAEDAGVAVVPLDLALAHVAHAAEDLHGLVHHELAGLDGGVLGKHASANGWLAGRVPDCATLARVGPGDVDAAVHVDELVPDDLPRRPAACRTSRAPARTERPGRGALRGGVRLHGEAEPLVDELLHDQHEPAVLLADEVLGRHADVVEGQLGGVGAEPAHLVEPAAPP